MTDCSMVILQGNIMKVKRVLAGIHEHFSGFLSLLFTPIFGMEFNLLSFVLHQAM